MSLLTVVYLLLFPLSSTVLRHVSGAIVAFIVFSSVFLYFFSNNEREYFTRDERQFSFSVVAMMVVAIFVTILSGMNDVGIGKLAKFIYLLMVIPVFYYFSVIRVRPNLFWYGLVIGAIVSALVGVYEVVNEVYKPGYLGRAKGTTHPIIFGDLALIMGAMALAGWGWFKAQARWQIILPIIAVFSGVLASVLSQSRGGWVAVPFVVMIYIWASSVHISKTKIVLSITSIAILFATLYSFPQTGMKDKINTTVVSIESYANSEVDSSSRASSLGSRFEMWHASWDIFLENPFIGVGWGNYQINAKKLVDKGVINRSAGSMSHPHNQFLSVMASGGVLSLIAIVFLFFIPAKIFYNAVKSPERSDDSQRVALAGLVFMVGFAVFNLSESFLERSRTVTFFIFYLAVCMAGIRENRIEITADAESNGKEGRL